MSPLSDGVVFITGAARGIGAGTARALAKRGARMILVDLDAEPLAQTHGAGNVRPGAGGLIFPMLEHPDRLADVLEQISQAPGSP